MSYYPLHIFCGFFDNGTAADEYISQQWIPEPQGVTDEEYANWENNNPTWQLEKDLEFFMDPDFVEPAYDTSYIQTMIQSESEKEKFLNSIPSEGRPVFIIVSKDGIWGDRRNPKDRTNIRSPENTEKLKYLGRYNWP
jgi:hypothetical protein